MRVPKMILAVTFMAAILFCAVGCGSDKSSSSSKADSPKVQGKYLGMTAQDFARSYNFTVSKLGKDHLQIVNTEINGRDVIYTIKASECRMGGMVQDGELVAVMVKGNKSSADFPTVREIGCNVTLLFCCRKHCAKFQVVDQILAVRL